jgi:hypothetical protein
MKIRKSLAGLTLAGSLALGFAGVAGAQTSSDAPPAPKARTIDCTTAPDRLAKAHERLDAAKARIAKAEARIDQLRSNGHGDRADVLAARLAKANDKLAEMAARLDAVTAKVAAHCASPAAT